MSRVIIAGSRKFNDWLLAWEFLERKLEPFIYLTLGDKVTEIVSGTANGADKLGEKYANVKGLPIKRFPADWSRYGKAAGHIRNKLMAEYADACVVFWDGESRGAMNMIACVRELNMPTMVVKYKIRRFQTFNLGGGKSIGDEQ